MQKPNRNEPCHCGSGKKYKKCCINKDEFEHLHADNDFKPNFSPKDKKHNALLKYKKNEVLKVLAYLQMLPQNHGKNIRIELLLTDILNADLEINEAINYQNLRNDLKKDCTKHPYEDPPEDFFTENIVFVNGNNIVYPGIFTRAADIVQSQLNAIFKDKNLPFQAVREIVEGTFFLLTLYGEIAKKLGHVHRLFEEAKEEALYIPPTSEIISNKELFSFSYEQLTGLCDRLAISKSVVREFVLDIDKKVSFSNPDSNPLFGKPFVQIEDEIILVMPTAELSAINNFLLEKLKQYNCVGQFTENFSNLTRQDVSMALRHMGWSALKSDFLKSETFDEIVVDQCIYQFDLNKIGYTLTVTHIPGNEKKRVTDFAPSNKKIVEIAVAASRVLKSKFHDYKIFLLIVLDRCDIFETYFLDYSGIKNFDQYLALTTQELSVIPKRWDFDALTLWKYASHAEENRDKMMFMPQNTHLSKFNWYKENFDCFFHPDKEPFNFAVFEFDIEGNVNRTAKLKIDKIGIPFKAERGIVHLPSRRKEEHYPVYISDEFRHGYFRNCLLKYSCPVWLQSNTVRDYTSDVYINGILYWLNQSFDELNEFFAVLGKEPIVITLIMDKAFDDKEKWDIEAGPDYADLSHQIIAKNRAIEINLPISIINHLMNSGNSGEKFLMVAIVRIIRTLISSLGLKTVLSDTDIKDVFDKVIQNPMHKMIIIAEASDNPIIADIDVDSPRYIQNADISYILHNQVSWLDKSIKIPKKITLTGEKVNLLNALVSVHFKRIIQSIAKYDEVALLTFLMNRHESLIQVREMRKLSYPTQEACYGQFYNVFEKFGKTESEIVSSSLAVRTLIEFVACERPKGKEICNDADIDLMLAQVSELVNYGAMSDSIKFGLDDPGMGMLPSGRIGIDTKFISDTMSQYKNDIHLEEFEAYKSSFKDFFTERQTKKAKKGDDAYFDRVDEVFMEEWGITIWDVVGACRFLCMELFGRQKSVDILSEEEIFKLFNEKTEQSENQTRAFLKLLTFIQRNGVLNTQNNELYEAFPWRYNRRISYMLRPLIKLSVREAPCYMISARHVLMAANNMLARFFDGTLKTDKSNLKVLNLLAERNHIKGKEFRDSIVKWLKTNTNLTVIQHEVKIKPKGFFPANVDKGDVDIMAIDDKKKIIYAIECKNTSQAKIAYDMYNEIQNYIGVEGKPGMIEKHVQREVWLNENLALVTQKLNLTLAYSIKSFVLTKHILPTKYISKTKIPVYSLTDLKNGRIFQLSNIK